MHLDNVLSAADPARRAEIGDPDSPSAAALYRRIVGTPPRQQGRGTPRRPPVRTHLRPYSGRQSARRHPRLSVVAAVAIASVAVMAVGLIVALGGSRAPTGALATGGVKPSATQRVAPSSLANQAGPVLDSLAAVAADSTATPLVPGPGQYLYVLDVELKGAPPAGGAAMACGSVIRQEWLASDGSGQQVGYSPGCGSNEDRFTQSWGTSGNGISFDYLAWQGLPTQAAAMEAAIVRRFEGGHANNAVTFLLATGVLNYTAPPAVRSALFRMLATMPGVHYLGKVTDPLGRSGDTIALIQPESDLVVIFDPKTSQVLDEAPTPTGGPIHLPRKMPPWLAPFMFVETGIVDSVTATPPGTSNVLSNLPYLRWVG
jgi:hypothetical protein